MRFQPFDKLAAMAAAVAILGLAALPLAARDEAEPDKERTVIKATLHIDVTEAQSVLDLLPVHFALKPDQNLIVLRGESYDVENAIKVIDALDTARPSIDIHLYVLQASPAGEATVPAELESAANQLRSIFGYEGFALLDSITLRVLEGRRARADGAIRVDGDADRIGYSFSFQKASVVPEDGHLNIRLKDLRFELDGEVAGTLRASLMTDVQIREGQKAVIGSSTPEGIGETLILIVEAKATADPKTQKE